jgi:hypothetical protein
MKWFLFIAYSCLAHGLIVALVASCARDDARLVTRDNDDFDIPEPATYDEGNYIWSDGAYLMSVYQIKKGLDPAKLLRVTRLLAPEEAENVNSLDEVPDSTWFTNRHGVARMTREALVRGPGDRPPEGTWIVIKGKRFGLNPGFLAKDAVGRLLFVKFDPPGYPGMGTNGDIIVSKFLHAAGYNVPEYYAVSISPDEVSLSPKAKIAGQYNVKRSMTREDLDRILAEAPRIHGGEILADVSVGIEGSVKGPFEFHGVRSDDPNDTVLHENRRELRGLGVFMAWFNNTDQRRGNTLDTYVEHDDRRFLKHYVIDFSGSFGSLNNQPKELRSGHEYTIDPEMIAASWLSVGLWVKPWEVRSAPTLTLVGYFESDHFAPAFWRSIYPNPAFERITHRDGFWAAKIITAFDDEDIRRVVATGYFPDSRSEEYLVRHLLRRRDIIGRFYFDHREINPLDRFQVEKGPQGLLSLSFVDLAVDRGYVEAGVSRYRYCFDNGADELTGAPRLPLRADSGPTCVRIETSRGHDDWGAEVRVSVAPTNTTWSVVRIER